MNNPTLSKVKTKSILMPLNHITLIILLLYLRSAVAEIYFQKYLNMFTFFFVKVEIKIEESKN